MKERGFTLLELLVATVIMGIAVAGLLSNISTSLRHASRLTEYDRAALVAQRTMDELLLDASLPKGSPIEGAFDAGGGFAGGWRAVLSNFEEPPQAVPATPVLERLELEVWWTSGLRRRNIRLEGFRRSHPLPAAAPGGQARP